jgi:anti-sigma factor (TIGR02949 family)
MSIDDELRSQPQGANTDLGHHHPHGGPSALDCSEALLRAFEFLDGEMEPGDFAKVRAHLDACAECLRQYDLDHMVKLMVKRSCTPEPAPTNLRAAIVSRLTVIRIETAD